MNSQSCDGLPKLYACVWGTGRDRLYYSVDTDTDPTLLVQPVAARLTDVTLNDHYIPLALGDRRDDRCSHLRMVLLADCTPSRVELTVAYHSTSEEVIGSDTRYRVRGAELLSITWQAWELPANCFQNKWACFA